MLHERVPRSRTCWSSCRAARLTRPARRALTAVALAAVGPTARPPDGRVAVRQSRAAGARPAQLHELGTAGPQNATSTWPDIWLAEQALGRVASGIDPHAAATLLIGACFHRAFLDLFFDAEAPPGVLLPAGDEEFAAETVRALLDGLTPPGRA